ncbi:MAG TPA: hypothetical protein VHW06_04150 [Streptosporangiaceae bacterium]|nr:hypothetical protein [Streptosporangiaceae bacterium]
MTASIARGSAWGRTPACRCGSCPRAPARRWRWPQALLSEPVLLVLAGPPTGPRTVGRIPLMIILKGS